MNLLRNIEIFKQITNLLSHRRAVILRMKRSSICSVIHIRHDAYRKNTTPETHLPTNSRMSSMMLASGSMTLRLQWWTGICTAYEIRAYSTSWWWCWDITCWKLITLLQFDTWSNMASKSSNDTRFSSVCSKELYVRQLSRDPQMVWPSFKELVGLKMAKIVRWNVTNEYFSVISNFSTM